MVSVFVFATWFCSADGKAEQPGLMLTPGVTCLERTALEESLDRALDGRVDGTGLEVEVLGSAHDPRTAVIRLSRAGEPLAQRAFSPGPPRCADFHAAIALAISLMIKNTERELNQAAASSAPTPAPGPPAPSPPADVVRTPRASLAGEPARVRAAPPHEPHATSLHVAPIDAPPAAPGRHPRSSSWRAQAAGVLGLQVGAPFSSGVTSDLVFAGSRFALQLGVLALFSTEHALGDTSFRYRTRPIAASLILAAALLTRPSLALRVSLGFLAGRMRTELRDDSGGNAADSERVPWFAGRAALELALPVARSLQLSLSAGPLWNIRKLGVSAYDADSAELIDSQRFKPVGALLGLGLAYEQQPGAFRQGFGVSRHPSP